MLKDGERHPLFEGTKIRVEFEHRADYDVVRWQADCNVFGAHVDVTKERLVTGEIVGTAEGCPKARLRRDRWMLRFFGPDPRWRIRDGRLKLTVGDRVVRLRRSQRSRAG